MLASSSVASSRGVRSLAPHGFRAPWPFVKKGSFGQRKIGPFVYEKHKIPGQRREFPELSPKFQKLNPPELADYTGVQPNGYVDPNSGEFVVVKEACAELVVPDLTGFALRPYVSFKTDVRIEERRRAYEEIVKQKGSEELADLYVLEDQRWPPPRITARTLFDLYYAQEIRQYFKEGRYGNEHDVDEHKAVTNGDEKRDVDREK
uniref:39S ribosomal protein L41, mitochondrial n=1 Tax=Parascaris univalens TaxID=6257 RepID=A0A914ZE85_PARUN